MRLLQENQSATLRSIIESFRFGDENEYKYEIKLKIYVRVIKKKTPWRAYFTFFTKKVGKVIYAEGGQALSW